MKIITCVLVLLALAIIAGVCYLVIRADELDEYEQDLHKYSVQLDERANKLAQWMQELMEWEKEARK